MRLFEREWSWSSRPLGQPWHSILLCVFAAPLLIACVWSYQATRDFLRSAQPSTGVVVSIIEKRGYFHPRVRFVDLAGREQTFESKQESRPPRFSVGQQVPVLYLPDSPDDATIEGFLELWFFTLITGIVGLALIVASTAIWIWRDKLFPREAAGRSAGRRSRKRT